MLPKIVTLDKCQRAHAEWVGERRALDAVMNGRREIRGASDKDNVLQHIEGAYAELACSLFFNLKWVGYVEDPYGLPDIGDWTEVRSTSHCAGGLIIQAWKDDPRRDFVLVAHLSPRQQRIVGWINGSVAMSNQAYAAAAKEKFLKYGESRYVNRFLVPQRDLRKEEQVPESRRD
jgi:hypothetical protein